MRTRRILPCVVLVAWAVLGSGCGIHELKDQNRRLRDSNERLIAENNQLEAELAGARSAPPPPPPPAPSETRSEDPAPVPSSLEDELLLDGDVEVAQTQYGVRIRVPDRVFFGPGQVRLTTQGKRVLDGVARLIRKKYPANTVRVDGHTDDTPTRKVRKQYPTNWELSTARACRVVRYLVDQGDVPAERIFPAGFAYHRPVAARTRRDQNRRVEILILDANA